MFWSAANEMVNNEKEELTMSEVEDMYAEIEERANLDRVENQEVEILKSLCGILSEQEVSDTLRTTSISKDEQTNPDSALNVVETRDSLVSTVIGGAKHLEQNDDEDKLLDQELETTDKLHQVFDKELTLEPELEKSKPFFALNM